MAIQADHPIPGAIYLDANALIAAPSDFLAQPIAEVIDLAGLLDVQICVPALASEEWLGRRTVDAEKAVSDLERARRRINALVGQQLPSLSPISLDDLPAKVRQVHLRRLEELGFQIVHTPELDAAYLVKTFLDKQPPFNDGDRVIVLGDLSIQGNIKSARSLAEPLQVAMDNGARRALVPLENKRNFLEVSGDIMEKVDPVFYSDPATAAMKGLGLT